MLIKLASLRRSSDLLAVAQRDARSRPQRDLGRVGSAARREEPGMTIAGGDRRQSARHARARRGEVRPPRDAVRVARCAWRANGARWTARASWGILLLAAARGSTITISADGADEERRGRRAGGAGAVRIRRGRMQRLNGIGVSPGIVVGRAVDADSARAGAALPRSPPATVDARARAARAKAAPATRAAAGRDPARLSRPRGPSWRRCSTRSC